MLVLADVRKWQVRICARKKYLLQCTRASSQVMVLHNLKPPLFTSTDLRCREARQYRQPEPHARARMLRVFSFHL